MITARVDHSSVGESRRAANALRREIQSIMSRRIWAAVNAAAAASISLINIKIDRPTPFTKSATGKYVRRESGLRVTGRVYLKNIQARYLSPLIEGGQVVKRKPIPFASSENKYGNFPRGITKRGNIRAFKGDNGKVYIQKKTGRRTVLVGTWSRARRYGKILPWRVTVATAGQRALRGGA